MTLSSSWPARWSLLAIVLILHSFSVVNADDHLKPRSIWSRRHRNLDVGRRQLLPGDGISGSQPDHLPDGTPGSLSATPHGDPTSVDPATLPSSTSHSTTASSPSSSSSPTSSADSSSNENSGSSLVASSSTVSSSSSSLDVSSILNEVLSSSTDSTTSPTGVTPEPRSTVPQMGHTTVSSTAPSTEPPTVTPTTVPSTEPLTEPSTPSASSASSTSSAPDLAVIPLPSSNSVLDVPVNLNNPLLGESTTSQSTAPSTEPTTVSSNAPATGPPTVAPATVAPTTVAPTTVAPTTVAPTTVPSTPSASSASSTSSAPDLAVLPLPSINSVSDVPVNSDNPLLKESTTSQQVSSSNPQVSSTPPPTPVASTSVDTATTSSTIEGNNHFSPFASLLPSFDDPPPSSSTVAPLSSSSVLPLSSSSEDPRSSDTDARPSSAEDNVQSSTTTEAAFNIPFLTALLPLPSSSTSESPISSIDLPISSSTTAQPPLSVDLPISSSTTTEAPFNVPILTAFLPLPSSSTSESPFLSIDLPISSSTTTQPIFSVDLPTSSSTTDFPLISSHPNDGDLTTQPPPRPTQPSVISSSTETPRISGDGSSILSLNMSAVLPSGPGTINTDGLSTVSMTESISISIRPEFHYLTASSLDIQPIPTTSTSVTNTNPDAPLSSVGSATQSNGLVIETVSAIPIPTNLPQFIKPSDQSDPVDLNSKPDGYTLITILFQKEVGWTKVLSTSDIAGAMMAYLPALVAAILNIDDKAVKLVGLKAYAGPDYQISQNLDDVQTQLLFYLKSDQVQTLKSYYTTSGSLFYTTGNTVTKQLTALVVKTFQIAATFDLQGTQNAATNQTTTTIDNGRRNAIIGVCATFGTIALGVFIWWMFKTRQRRQNVHNRLRDQQSPNYGTTGASRVMEERRANVGGGGGGGSAGRRNSFYAFGQDNENPEDDTFDYLSQHSHGGSGGHGNAVRRPVAGQPISQPILRETSMGQW